VSNNVAWIQVNQTLLSRRDTYQVHQGPFGKETKLLHCQQALAIAEKRILFQPDCMRQLQPDCPQHKSSALLFLIAPAFNPNILKQIL
jgi:hypothetical protein